MPVTRRGFFGAVRGGSGAAIAARGHEAYQAEQFSQTPAQQGSGTAQQGRRGRAPLPEGMSEIRISSNENPLGPGKAVLDAILGKFPEAGRYPFNSTPNDGKLTEMLAATHKVKGENLVLGAGSQEIL
jgi:histidinol-phosphate/aromatic aminotransferase/cobyric acid decarboxylase-like protein